MVAVWAWSQRYELLEREAIAVLAEDGITAELDIISITRSQAQIRNIRLSYEDAPFLRVDEVQAEFDWRDAIEGRFERLDFKGVTAKVQIDATGQIIDGWVPPGLTASGPGGGDAFPARGIGIKDSTLNLTTPFGEATLYADAELASGTRYDAAITLAPSELSWRTFEATGAGVAEISRNGDQLRIDGQVQTERLSHQTRSLRDAHLRAEGAYDLSTQRWDGEIAVDGKTLDSQAFAADAVELTWDGEINHKDEIVAAGDWAMSATRARTPDTSRAQSLAETLSLASALSVVPIAEHFSPELTQTVKTVLSGADVSGAGRLAWTPTGFTLTPITPIEIVAPNTTVTLHPRSEAAFYHFDNTKGNIRAELDARFTNPVGLELNAIELEAKSENGWRLDGVQRFASQVKTSENWRTVVADAEPIRLRPFQSRVIYDGENRARRGLTVNTDLDYDGPLPGGVVEGLRLAGRLDVRLRDWGQALDFTPQSDTPITLDRLETPTDWVAEDIRFGLSATPDIFVRRADRSEISATPLTPEFILTRPATDLSPTQRIDMSAQTLEIAGTLRPDATQDWRAVFTEAEYASATLPGPETTAQASTATLIANFAPGQAVQINLQSPAINAQTPLVEISDMRIALNGTPEAYIVEHSGGRVRLIGSAAAETAKAAGVAELPLGGTVRFNDGAFIGAARTNIAKANGAEVEIDYRYANGEGTAEIDIPQIQFTPGGLQPQALLPALKGKIARVTGTARAALQIAFANGALTDSSGEIALIDMDVGTAPGPIEGLDTVIQFSSLFPVQTTGVQRMRLRSFNPGLQLADGEVAYELVPNGVRVTEAAWPIGNGRLSMDPFTWVYAAEENRVTMRVEDVALGDFLEEIGNETIRASGMVTGVFPIVVRGVQVLVENGYVSVPDGGVIRIDLPAGDAGGGTNYISDATKKALKAVNTGDYPTLTREALREFEYRELRAAIDGPLDGEIAVGLIFDGSNRNVLNGQPFRFDIDLRGELFNILKSFNSNDQIKIQVLRDRMGLSRDVEIVE